MCLSLRKKPWLVSILDGSAKVGQLGLENSSIVMRLVPAVLALHHRSLQGTFPWRGLGLGVGGACMDGKVGVSPLPVQGGSYCMCDDASL